MAALEAEVSTAESTSTAMVVKTDEDAPKAAEEHMTTESEVVNGVQQEADTIANNVEDIKSDEEEVETGSLVLDDFLDSLDVLDSWNPDEDELEGIGEDQPQENTEKSEKEPVEKSKRDKSRDKVRKSRRDSDDKRNSRRRNIHRECSLERPPRSRLHANLNDVKDLRDLLPIRSRDHRDKDSRDHRDHRDHRDLRDFLGSKSPERSKEHRERKERERDKDRHREKEKDKSRSKPPEKVVEKSKEVKEENDVKPPPGVVPAPRIKLPSDDLVPPGTEDEFWPKEEETMQVTGKEENISMKVEAGEEAPEGGAEASQEPSAREKERRSRAKESRDRERSRDLRAQLSLSRMRNRIFNDELRRKRDRHTPRERRSRERPRDSERDREALSPPRVPRRRFSRSRSRDRRRFSRSRSRSRERRRFSRSRSREPRRRPFTRSPPPKRSRITRSRSRSLSRSRSRGRGKRFEDYHRPQRNVESSHRAPTDRRPPNEDSRPVAGSRRSQERQTSPYMYERFSSPSLSFELSPVSSDRERGRSFSRTPSRERRRGRQSPSSISDSSLSLSSEPYSDNYRPRKRVPFVKELERMFGVGLDSLMPSNSAKAGNTQYGDGNTRPAPSFSTREDGTSLEAPPPPVISADKMYESSKKKLSKILESTKGVGQPPSQRAGPSTERAQLLLLRCEEAIRTLASDGGLSVTGRFIVTAPSAPPPPPPSAATVPLRSPLLRRYDAVKYAFCNPWARKLRRVRARARRGSPVSEASSPEAPPTPPPCTSCEERRARAFRDIASQTDPPPEPPAKVEAATQADPPEPPQPPRQPSPPTSFPRGPKKIYKPEDPPQQSSQYSHPDPYHRGTLGRAASPPRAAYAREGGGFRPHWDDRSRGNVAFDDRGNAYQESAAANYRRAMDPNPGEYVSERGGYGGEMAYDRERAAYMEERGGRRSGGGGGPVDDSSKPAFSTGQGRNPALNASHAAQGAGSSMARGGGSFLQQSATAASLLAPLLEPLAQLRAISQPAAGALASLGNAGRYSSFGGSGTGAGSGSGSGRFRR